MGVFCGRQLWCTTAAALRRTAAACLCASPAVPARLCSELYHHACNGASHTEGGGQGYFCAAVHRVGWQKVNAQHVCGCCVTRQNQNAGMILSCGKRSVFAMLSEMQGSACWRSCICEEPGARTHIGAARLA